MLRGRVLYEEAQECADTLVESLIGCVKKGSSAEGILATTALSLTFITVHFLAALDLCHRLCTAAECAQILVDLSSFVQKGQELAGSSSNKGSVSHLQHE